MSVQDRPTRRRMIVAEHDAEELIRKRALMGMHRYDEVWDGEYRTSPGPGSEHVTIDVVLTSFLHGAVSRYGLGSVGRFNVRPPGTGDKNFRIPDLSFISASREQAILSAWGCEGAPDLAVEIRSEGDDTYEKLPFYSQLGVAELLVLRGKSKWVELFRNIDGALLLVAPAADGWLRLETLPVEVRAIVKPDGRGGAEVRDSRDPALAVTI